jgi:hypothetical protein
MHFLNKDSLFQNIKLDEDCKEVRIRLAPAPGRGID